MACILVLAAAYAILKRERTEICPYLCMWWRQTVSMVYALITEGCTSRMKQLDIANRVVRLRYPNVPPTMASITWTYCPVNIAYS